MCVSPFIVQKNDMTLCPVPCGHCIECRKDWQNDWTFRLTQEVKRCKIPIFLTLTYDDEHLPLGDVDLPFPEVETLSSQSVLVKSDFQKFMKRLRKHGKETLKDCRYFAVGEYGSRSNRCHFHAVIIAPNLTSVGEFNQILSKSWDNGFFFAKFCTSKQIHYVCKYMNKLDERPHLVPPFRLYSRSIGLNFLSQKMIDYYLTTFDRTCLSGKYRISLPRYYRKKLDALSDSNYFLKKSGLTYSDLLADIKPDKNSHYYYFKQFCENYEAAYAFTIQQIAYCSRVHGYQFYEPSRQEVFWTFIQSHKMLRDLVFESDRLLNKCVLRNKLRGLQPITKLNELEILHI